MDYKDYQAGAARDFFWFRAKTQLIDVLLSKLKTEKRLKILNIGAGTGDDLHVISRLGDVYVVDIDSKSLKMIPEKSIIEKKQCDACKLPYPDNFFDLVVAFDVLEHIEDDMVSVNEIYRVLYKDGSFVFTVPALEFLYSSHDRALDHFRRYSKKSINKLLSNFMRIELGYWVFTLFAPVFLQRMLKRNETNPKSQLMKLPAFINGIFYYILCIENWLISCRVSLPVGTTLYGIYKKK